MGCVKILSSLSKSSSLKITSRFSSTFLASNVLFSVLKKLIKLSISSRVVVSSIVKESVLSSINLKLIPSSTDLLNKSLALLSSITRVSKYRRDKILKPNFSNDFLRYRAL